MYGKMSFLLNSTYTGRQYSDELNTVAASSNGLTGIIPAHFLLNTTARYFIEGL
jgi:hypothetical protein